jgi:protease-4
MRRLLVGLLATIGFLTLLALGALVFLVSRFLPETPSLPPRILLTADWTDELTEAASTPDLLDLELRPPPTVSEIVLALDAAAKDRRVAGLLVRVAETSHGFGVTQELRDAVTRFRASGRFAVAYADTFGELSSGNEGYYLATAFDQIVLQPVGLVGLTGLSVQVPLARDLLASLGVRFELSRRAEYKTALESLTESELSGPNREQLDALLDTLSGQLVDGIAEGRRMKPEAVRRLIDRGPFTGQEAREAGLIDNILYDDQMLDSALRRAGGKTAGAVPLEAYADQLARPGPGAPTVALIRASGLIRRGDDAIGLEIAADDLVEALEDAAWDRAVRAVVLRLDTGGGSAVASETIARAVRRVRGAGKPMIVSMSNAAASGGYWIAMDAHRIVAQPGTLTGSIGVVAGKLTLEEAWDKLGVRWAEIARGANAGLWSVNLPYSEEGRARVDSIVGSLYESFTDGVARGRNLPPERVREIAKGRVWAGETALGLGLVDELGGLHAALAAVRRELELPADAELRVELLPDDGGPLRALWRSLRPSAAGLELALGSLQRLRTALSTAVSLPLTLR